MKECIKWRLKKNVQFKPSRKEQNHTQKKLYAKKLWTSLDIKFCDNKENSSTQFFVIEFHKTDKTSKNSRRNLSMTRFLVCLVFQMKIEEIRVIKGLDFQKAVL